MMREMEWESDLVALEISASLSRSFKKPRHGSEECGMETPDVSLVPQISLVLSEPPLKRVIHLALLSLSSRQSCAEDVLEAAADSSGRSCGLVPHLRDCLGLPAMSCPR